MTSQIQEITSEAATATLGAPAVRGGVFHSPIGLNLGSDESRVQFGAEGSGPHKVFSRKIGLQYVLQVWANSLPLLLVDIFVLTATIAICRVLFHKLNIPVGIDISSCLIAIATGFVLINLELGLYPGVRLSPVEELRRIAVSVSCMFIVWSVGVALLMGGLDVQKWFLLAVYLACLVSLPVCRGWARYVLGRFTQWGIPVLVCGEDIAAIKIHRWLSDNRQLGLRPVGVIASPGMLDIDGEEACYAGSWPDTQQVAADRGVYWAVVVPPENRPAAISSLIADYLSTIPHLHVLSELTGLPDHWTPQQLDGLTGIHLQQNLLLPFPRITKRLLDLAGSIVGGVALLPLLFYICVAVKLSSRGPIFYGHERIGRGGRRFRAWKFRSMFENSNQVLDAYLDAHPQLKEEWEKDHKLRYDPRITRIGRFMRKSSIDELPQLWNVIRGEMSLVGPRPVVTAEIAKYGLYFELYTLVKPGITGLWQVSGRNNTTYDERVQLDAYYVRNWSPWLDIYLLLRTVRIVLFSRGAY